MKGENGLADLSLSYGGKIAEVIVLRIVRQGFQIFGIPVVGDTDAADLTVFGKGYTFLTTHKAIIGKAVAGDGSIFLHQSGNGQGILSWGWDFIHGCTGQLGGRNIAVYIHFDTSF